MKTNNKNQAGAAFVIATLLFLAIHSYYDVRHFTFDAKEYWEQALLAAPGGRGYLYPLLLAPARLLFQGDAQLYAFRILSSLVYAAVLTLMVPRMFVTSFGGTASFVRRLVPPLLLAVVFPGTLVYPMSDLPALLLCCAALMLVADPRHREPSSQLVRHLLAGVLMGAAYNTRSIYLFAVLIVALWLLQRPRLMAAFVLGAVLAGLPQAVINKRSHDVWSLNPTPTAHLFAFQLFKGLEIQRYETAAAPEGVPSGVPYIDRAGRHLLEKPGVDEEKQTLANYLSIVASYPLDAIGVYGRHFINGLDVRDGRLYVTRASSTRGANGLLSFLLLALATWSLVVRAQREGTAGWREAPRQWPFWCAALLAPVIAITPGAVETRFYLPLHFLAFCVIAFQTSPAVLAGHFRRRYFRVLASLLGALCIFNAVTFSTMAQ